MLRRVQVAPISHQTTAALPVASVSNWSAGIPDAQGPCPTFHGSSPLTICLPLDPSIQYYTLSLITPTSVYTVTLTPSRVCHTHGYHTMSALSPSTLRLTSTPLPITLDKSVTLCSLGPSGTRAIYVERSRYGDQACELVVFAGPLRKISGSVRPDSRVGVESQKELPEFNVSRRLVLPGMVSKVMKSADKVAFDECSGRVCVRHARGAIAIVDFANVAAIP